MGLLCMVNTTTNAGIIGPMFNSVVKKQQQKLQKFATFFLKKPLTGIARTAIIWA